MPYFRYYLAGSDIMTSSTCIIEIEGLKNQLGSRWVHDGLNLTVRPQEILAIVGGSGSGKTTLLRCILMLHKPTAGLIKIFNTEIAPASPANSLSIRRRWGVMFQQGALFSSLTVLENVTFPLRLFTQLPPKVQEKIGLLKIALVGLPADAAIKYPAQLSGGMIKRVALARAIALDPEILFLDEPTSGLDPKSAIELDDLILNLRNGLGLTVVIITHDMDLLWRISDRVAFLAAGKVLAESPIKELVNNSALLIKEYFSNVNIAAQ